MLTLMKRSLPFIFVAAAAGLLLAQGPKQFKRNQGNSASPAKETMVVINGKTINISYSAPSMRGRTIFGEGGIVSKDPIYPVWRAGADDATCIHTDAPLDIAGLAVPAGDYSLFVDLSSNPWKLIVNKQTGQWGLSYKKDQDLGRVNMTVSKPSSPVETYYMKLSATGGNKGKLELGWEHVVASVNFTVK